MSPRSRTRVAAFGRISIAFLTLTAVALSSAAVILPALTMTAGASEPSTSTTGETTTTLRTTSTSQVSISLGTFTIQYSATWQEPETTSTAGTTSTTESPPTSTTAAPITTTTAPTTSTTRAPTTTVPMPSTTTTLHPDGILGLISASGVPVRLKATEGDLWLVATPCGRDEWLRGGTPLYRTTVILDPGHGGSVDIGATGPNGLQEKLVNLRIARVAQQLLEAQGIATTLTRTADYASILSARAAFADALQAEIMVSIHHNAPTPPPSAEPGNEVYIQSGSEKSRRLGGLLYQYSMAALSQFDIQWSSTVGAGVMTVRLPSGADAYGILRHPKTPTALLEFGRLSNAPEAALFATDAYVQAAAKSVSDAVHAYLFTDETGSGWVTGRTRTPRLALSQASCIDPRLE